VKDLRKLQFLAFLLPLIGFLLIMPPLVSIANVNAMIFGFPSIIAFLFIVWFLLIGGAYLFQRRIASLDIHPTGKTGSETGKAALEK